MKNIRYGKIYSIGLRNRIKVITHETIVQNNINNIREVYNILNHNSFNIIRLIIIKS